MVRLTRPISGEGNEESLEKILACHYVFHENRPEIATLRYGYTTGATGRNGVSKNAPLLAV